MMTTDTVQLTDKERAVVAGAVTERAHAKYQEYISRYRSFTKASAENFINLAETVVDAERQLTPTEFEKFCEAVQLVAKSSTLKKIKAIGENRSRFEPFLERLPHSWTTLYMLAILPPDKFDSVVNSGRLNPLATAKELKAAANRDSDAGSSDRKTSISQDIILDLRDLDNDRKIAVHQGVSDLQREFKFRMHIGRVLTELLEKKAA